MTIPDEIDMATVELLVDCDNFSAEDYVNRRLRHLDGRPFTDEEHTRVGQARRAEIETLAAISQQRAEHARQHAEDLGEMSDLMQPYAERFGEPVTVGFIRTQMPTDKRQRLDQLIARCETRIDQGLVNP
jgi:hypothetical protein